MESKDSAEEALKLVEIELGFLYDMLYTKAPAIFTLPGIIFRSLSMACVIIVFLVFALYVNKHRYENIDLSVTYILFISAAGSEIYAIILLKGSDWTTKWLSKPKNRVANMISKGDDTHLKNAKRWSGRIAQIDILGFCMKENRARCIKLRKYLSIQNSMKVYQTTQTVSLDLKQFIYERLRKKEKTLPLQKSLQELHAKIEDGILTKYGCQERISGYYFRCEGEPLEIEYLHNAFEETLLIWHVGTNISYCFDEDRYDDLPASAKTCKLLSNYLLYVLVVCPFMTTIQGEMDITLKNVIDAIVARYQATEATSPKQLMLGGNDFPSRPIVLYKGRMLAIDLFALEFEEKWALEQKWEMVSEVWIEILIYVALQHEWKQHIQALRHGGELLTHVRVLIAHLGFLEDYDIVRDLCEIIDDKT